jgi:hypothetical protein
MGLWGYLPSTNMGIEMDFINRFGVEIPKFRGTKPLF